MPVKVYDGTNWVTVAGDGAQGAAAASSSIATWVKTASGGETTLSGNDDNSVSLSYTVGQELLYINGVLQKRAVDYVATTGTTITGLNALTVSDVVTVWTVNAFSVTNAIPNSTITAKGDLIVGTGSGTYTTQTVGTNGQVLTADSAEADGVKWAAGGKVLQVVNTIYGTETSTASSTFADTGLTATITPTSATSKILAFVTMPVYKDTSNTNGEFKLIRTATTIATMSNVAYTGTTSGLDVGTTSINYLDSPATTSATTYKVQFASQANNSRVVINRGGGQTNQSSITLIEIGA